VHLCLLQDNEKLDETIVRPEESSALQKQLQVCYNRMAELEEMVDGKCREVLQLILVSYMQQEAVCGVG